MPKPRFGPAHEICDHASFLGKTNDIKSGQVQFRASNDKFEKIYTDLSLNKCKIDSHEANAPRPALQIRKPIHPSIHPSIIDTSIKN